jgi:hypothetical protein
MKPRIKLIRGSWKYQFPGGTTSGKDISLSMKASFFCTFLNFKQKRGIYCGLN